MRNLFTKKINYIIAVCSIIIINSFASISAAQAEQTKKSQPVKIKQAETGNLAETLKITGEINAANKIIVKSMLDGYLNYSLLKEGDIIKKNQKIAEIKRESFASEISSAEAALATAEAILKDLSTPARQEEITMTEEKIKRLKANLEFSEKDLARIRQMVEKKYLPVEDLEKAELAYTNLKSEFITAKEQLNIQKNGAPQSKIDIQKSVVAEKKANLELIKSRLSEANISAPFNATISKIFLQPGDLCKSGSPIFEIYDNESISVKFSISENYLSKVSLKKKISVLIDVFPNKKFTAEISKIYPEIDQRTRTVTLEAKLLNAPKNIFPGMFARIELSLSNNSGIIIPSQAVITNAKGEKGVFTAKDGAAKFIKIKIINENNNRAIIEGLSSGDAVIIEGQESLKNGDSIKVIGGEKK